MTDRLYRKSAGIVLFNKDKKVLLCQRLKNKNPDNWQFPQGGIDEGETPIVAAIRELKEETNVSSIKLVHSLETPLRYDFPPDVKGYWKKRSIYYMGQEQYWSLFYFCGEDTEIDLKNTDEVEFRDYRWVNIEESLDHIWKPKKEVYKAVVSAFSPIIENYK